LFSCENKAKETLSKTKEVIQTTKDTVRNVKNSNESVPKKSIDLSSKLKEKVGRLARLKHNYQLKNLDTIVARKTFLLGNVKRIQKLKDSSVKYIDTNIFERELHQIHKAFLKGSKPMYPNEATYPRVIIEEYIFTSAVAATKIATMIQHSKQHNSRIWTYVNKAPHDYFVEENRLYFVSSGGFYMMDIYKDIVEELKD
jgi:protein required for attachment to host cells